MTSEERRIINGLLARDNRITQVFLFTKCRPMFYGIIHNVFRDQADYEELVNDLYLHLMENDGRRLRSFGQNDVEDNDQNTAYALIKWLKTTAWRFFADKAEKEQEIEQCRNKDKDKDGEETELEIEDKNSGSAEISLDFNAYLGMVRLEREREVLKKCFVEGLEPDVISEQMGISVDNFYNIKSRAIKKLQRAARYATSRESLCSIICEQYALDIFGIHKSLDALRTLSAEKGWLTGTGVTLENIGTLCREFGLTVEAGTHGQMEDIEEAMSSGKQVIVAVDGGELIGNQLEEEIEDVFFAEISDHCVVVLAVEDDTVSLFDPALGDAHIEVSREHFVDAWKDSGNYYVAVSNGALQK